VIAETIRIFCPQHSQISGSTCQTLVPRKQRKRRRLPGLSSNSCVRHKALHRNHVWSYDFVADRTEDGRQLKLLVVIDEFTRECLAAEVGRTFTSREVILTLQYVFAVRGAPQHIRSDNGPEFVAEAVRKWLRNACVDVHQEDLPYPQPSAFGPDTTCDTLGCADASRVSPAIVINELHYHPNEVLGQNLEFVELHNRAAIDIDLTGYGFNNGIDFTFPEGAAIPAGGYVLLLKDAEARSFGSRPGDKFGPYAGSLADGGERLTLHHEECVVETVRYDDRNPWPLAPDGYKPTLKRSSRWTSAEDPHSWRTTLKRSGELAGTPGEENSTLGTPTHPFITSFQTTPEYPTSSNAVVVPQKPKRPTATAETWAVSSGIAKARDLGFLAQAVVMRQLVSVTRLSRSSWCGS
jgi:hypothetical protein